MAVAGGITKDLGKENTRKESVCNFDNDISKEEFYNIVKIVGKSIYRITNLDTDGPSIYGTVMTVK